MSSVARSQLSRIVLMVRGPEGIARAVNFYHEAVGLPVLRVTDDWAELAASDSLILSLQAAATSNEAALSTGYSPWLTFTVHNMDDRIAACVQSGAHLDGPIQYPAHGKVAVLRSPDNHMIGLYEPASGSVRANSASIPRK
jgi:predicted enzyme related to lactoylglutathione lyase